MPGHSLENQQDNEHLKRAYTLDSVDAARNLYTEWAQSYDSELSKLEYVYPQAAVDEFVKYWPETPLGKTADVSISTLDAGCGTGMVADALKKTMQPEIKLHIDGIDLTQGMLDVAKQKGNYRDLQTADLNEALKFKDASYDAVFCVGTLTRGHVGPKCIGEFARVVKPGGLVVATVHADIFDSHGYSGQIDELRANGQVKVLSTAEHGVTKSESAGGIIAVLQCV